MPPFSRPWEHSRSSCGSAISTNLPRGKRAWVPAGPALNIYETQLKSKVRDLLEIMALENAPVITQLYMIGKSENNAKPIIMVCCTNKEAGTEAKKALKESDILDGFPAFTFRWTSLPLGFTSAAQPLAGGRLSSEDDAFHADPWETDRNSVFSTTSSPHIGRRFFKSAEDGCLGRWAIGGVILQRNARFFQLTVEHTQQDATDDDEEHLQSGLNNELDSDSDSNEEESESFEVHYDILSQGSETPGPSIIARSFASQKQRRSISWKQDHSHNRREDWHSLRTRSSCEMSSRATTGANGHRTGDSWRNNIAKVGSIITRASDGDRPGLDYSMVAIEISTSLVHLNELVLPHGLPGRCLVVRDAVTSVIEECRVFLVAADGNLIPGTVAPGTILFKRKTDRHFEDMHLVQLDGSLSYGDCGAAVVDQISGALYGHLVRGCPGTGIGYIIPAANVLKDLASRDLEARLAASTNTVKSLAISSTDSARSRNFFSAQDVDPHIATARFGVLPSTQTSFPTDMQAKLRHLSAHIDRSYFRWPEYMFPPKEEKRNIGVWESGRYAQAFGLELFGDEELPLGDDGVIPNRQLRNFCSGATIEGLIQHVPQKRLIWLDEKDAATGLKRPPSRLLTAGELYNALNEERFSGQLNADRRLIYIHDFDPWTALALIATCSIPSSSILMGAMNKHLRLSAHFGATLSQFRQHFSLSFHLPYYVWRNASDVHCETESFRKKLDLSFLGATHPTNFLYQTQVTCVVFGYDQWRWTGMMLLDSFFESEEQKKDFRDEMEDVDCGIVFDPLTDRTCDASSPIWQPVSYFIRVLRIRIKRVSEEFDQVAWKLENALNSKISEFDTQEKPSLLDRVWGQRFNGLILQLIHTISRVLDGWNRLESHEIVALLGPSTSVDDLQEDVVVIHDIRKSVDELREIRGTLLRLQDICNSESQPVGPPPYVVEECQSMTTEIRKATTDPTGPVQTQILRSILQITRIFIPIIASAGLLSADLFFSHEVVAFVFFTLLFAFIILAIEPFMLWYKEQKARRNSAFHGTHGNSSLGAGPESLRSPKIRNMIPSFLPASIRRRREKMEDLELGRIEVGPANARFRR